MSVECPAASFRDVTSAEEGAAHAESLTKSIASRFVNKDGDAAAYLAGRTGNGKGSAAAASLLATHPIDPGVKTALGALCALPSVGPQVAHAVATRFGSVGALMEWLFDPGMSQEGKIRDLEGMQRAGGERARRVGPKAARQILEMLTSDNPDLMAHGGGD